MRPERAFDRNSVDLFGTRPAFGRAQNDHRPDRLFNDTALASRALNRSNLRIAVIERLRQELMDDERVVARRRELAEEKPHAVLIARNLRVNLSVRSFEIGVRIERWSAVSRARYVDDVGVTLFDEPVQMDVDEVLSGRRTPVAEQSRLDLVGGKGLAQKRVFEEVDLTDTQIIRGAPITIHPLERPTVQGPGRNVRNCRSNAVYGDGRR